MVSLAYTFLPSFSGMNPFLDSQSFLLQTTFLFSLNFLVQKQRINDQGNSMKTQISFLACLTFYLALYSVVSFGFDSGKKML